ncbi:hypothetical protein GCM10009801_00900 [Streptomyces albiaxialis]|uniref:Secreted protein n=1 Tax=Streptomyces albiaxialis TaxID=329523 RepID=A0ABN2VDG4_9ACTN
MSAISLILLCAAALATALGAAALCTALGLRRQLTELRAEAARVAGAVPQARNGASADEIRSAVADALAEERERELAEARAFWAAQEARDAAPENGTLLAGHGTEYEIADGDLADQLDELLEAYEGELFIPRQPQEGPDDADVEAWGEVWDEAREGAWEALAAPEAGTAAPEPEAPEPGTESPGLAAARRRHPSHPDFNLNGEPVVPAPAPSSAPTVADHERTVERLAALAGARTPLADVRPGPLGTLDVYVFEDGTTVCLSPGHRATSEALSDALRLGEPPVLMGGSGIAGSYALTFGLPNGETAYLLADRVIASL